MALNEEWPLVADTNSGDPQEEAPISPLKRKLLKAAGCASVLSFGLFETSSLGCAQSLGGYVPKFQLNLWRFLAQFVFCVIIVAWQKTDIRIGTNNVPYLLIVCLAYNVENITTYTSSVYLPVGTVAGFMGALILVMTVAVAVVLKRKCLRLHTLLVILLVLMGIVFVTQPEFLFGDSVHTIQPLCPRPTSDQNASVFIGFFEDNIVTVTPVGGLTNTTNGTNSSSTAASTDTTLGYINLVISSSSFVLITFVINSKLQKVNAFVQSVWVGASGVIISLIGMGIFETPMLPAHASCQFLLAGHAVSVAVMNLLITVSLQLIVPEWFALLSNMHFVFLFCAQYIVLAKVNPGHRNAMEIAGAAVIIVGSCFEPIYSLCKDAEKSDRNGEADMGRPEQNGEEHDVQGD